MRQIELRGMFFDGEVYIGDAGVKTVSKLPTREEAIGIVHRRGIEPRQETGWHLQRPGDEDCFDHQDDRREGQGKRSSGTRRPSMHRQQAPAA